MTIGLYHYEFSRHLVSTTLHCWFLIPSSFEGGIWKWCQHSVYFQVENWSNCAMIFNGDQIQQWRCLTLSLISVRSIIWVKLRSSIWHTALSAKLFYFLSIDFDRFSIIFVRWSYPWSIITLSKTRTSSQYVEYSRYLSLHN